LYQYLINKNLKNKDFTYYIQTASLFTIKLKKIVLPIKDKKINIDYIYAKWNPIYFLLKKNFLRLEIYKSNLKTSFLCKKQNKSFIITGYIPLKFIQHFSKNYQFLKKDIFVSIKLNFEKEKIKLNSIQITGDFILKGKAYIKNHFFVFNGKLEYRNFKKNVSYYLKI